MTAPVAAMAYESAAAEWEVQAERKQWDTAGRLAAAIDPTTVQTPALDLIDEALAWAYSTRGARLIVSIGPQEGKSTRISKIGSLWALTRNPEMRIGIVSYAQPLAESFGREIRNWITTYDGTDGTLDLGLRIAPDYGSAKRWQLDGHRGGVLCAGLQGGISGRPLDALVIDDPFADRKQADSSYYRELVWEWWRSVGARRLAPGGPVIQVTTRWHEDDLAGKMLAAEDKHRWRLVNIPAIADHKPEAGETDLLGRKPGQWLSSARGRTDAEWEQIRIESGSRNFAALYQGRPSPDEGNVWLRQWWRRYQVPLWSQHPAVPGAYIVSGADEVVISFDCSFKDTKGSDYVAGQVWCRIGANVYLLDQVHKRLGFTDTLTAFTALAAKWPQASRKLVEAAANGHAVIDSLKGKIPGIVPVKATESKYARASAVAPFIEAGNVFVPDPEIALFDAESLIDEAAGFPNAAHDDQVDAGSQALREMLLDGTGAAAWIAWAKRKAEEAAARAGGELPAEPEAEPAGASPVQSPPPATFSPAQLADARQLIAAGRITAIPGEPGVYQAASSRPGVTCRVTADSCDCPAGQHSRPCKHRAAAVLAGALASPAEATAELSPAEILKQARDAAFRAQRWR